MAKQHTQDWEYLKKELYDHLYKFAMAVTDRDGECAETGSLDFKKFADPLLKYEVWPLITLSRKEARQEAIEECGKEIVICAAVRAKDGTVIRGHRHGNALQALQMIPGYEKERPHGDDQGFVTSKNRYVNRKEAYQIQKAAGIPSALEGTEHARSAYAAEECFSEDLY